MGKGSASTYAGYLGMELNKRMQKDPAEACSGKTVLET